MHTITGAVISQGSTSSQWTYEAMKHYFSSVDMLDIKYIEIMLGKTIKILYEGRPLKKYDGIYAKGSFRFAPLLQAITHALYPETYIPIIPSAFTYGHNKLLTQMELQKHHVPMPATYLTATTESAKNLLGNLNYPIIMKFPEGTHGKGVLIADSFASASSMLDALQTLKQPFIIQEYIDTGGKDLRVFVVGKKVAACMERIAQPGEERANIHAGATAVAKYIDPHTTKIAVDAAQAIGADICAVDMLETAQGSLVLEVNLSPGLQGITAATNINLADKIAQYLAERTLECKQKREGTSEDILQDSELKTSKIQEANEVITTLTIRGERILLPSLATTLSGFDDKKEVSLRIRKGEVVIQRY